MYRKNRQELIDSMIDRQGFVSCQFCGRSQAFKFHCHHLVFRSEKPGHPDINCKNNLLIVCNECHDALHFDKGLRNYIVELRELNLIFGDDILNK